MTGEHIADRIKRLRVAHQMTQVHLGVVAGIAQSSITALERGHTLPARETLRKLASAFGVPVGQLEHGADFTRRPTARKRRALFLARRRRLRVYAADSPVVTDPPSASEDLPRADLDAAAAQALDAIALDAAIHRHEEVADLLTHIALLNTDTLRLLRRARVDVGADRDGAAGRVQGAAGPTRRRR